MHLKGSSIRACKFVPRTGREHCGQSGPSVRNVTLIIHLPRAKFFDGVRPARSCSWDGDIKSMSSWNGVGGRVVLGTQKVKGHTG